MRWSPETGRPPERVLLIQLRGVGDVVLVTPILDALRTRWPDTKIHWFTDPRIPPLFSGDPRVDTFWIQTGWLRIAAYAQRLRRERFDLVLDLQSLPVTAVLSRATGGYVVGFSKRGRALFQDCPVDLRRHRGTGYALDHKLDLLRAIGMEVSVGSPRLAPPSHPHPVWNDTPPGARVALVPTSHLDHKRWDPHAFAAVADGLVARGATVIPCGGPGEEDQLRAVTRLMASAPPDPVVARDLAGFKQLLAGADLFLGNDTGPRHIAVALGLATIGWFDTPNPSNWTPPDAERHPVIWDRDKAAGRFLREDLIVLREDPAEVLKAALELLPALAATGHTR